MVSFRGVSSNTALVHTISEITLDKGDTISANLRVIPYAPHNITSRIRPTHSNSMETALVIEVTGSPGGVLIAHRADFAEKNSSWMPLGEEYEMVIENAGNFDNITVTIMIDQIGPPVSRFYDESAIYQTILPVIALILGPILGLTAFLLLYRRLTRHDS